MVFWWARGELNSHGLLHTLLRRTRIPVPPRALGFYLTPKPVSRLGRDLLIVIKMRMEFGLRNVDRSLPEKRSRRALVEFFVIRNRQRLAQATQFTAHFNVAAFLTKYGKAELLENTDGILSAQNFRLGHAEACVVTLY